MITTVPMLGEEALRDLVEFFRLLARRHGKQVLHLELRPTFIHLKLNGVSPIKLDVPSARMGYAAGPLCLYDHIQLYGLESTRLLFMDGMSPAIEMAIDPAAHLFELEPL